MPASLRSSLMLNRPIPYPLPVAFAQEDNLLEKITSSANPASSWTSCTFRSLNASWIFSGITLVCCDTPASSTLPLLGCVVNCSVPILTGDSLGWESVAVHVVVAELFDVSACLKMGEAIIGELSIVFQRS